MTYKPLEPPTTTEHLRFMERMMHDPEALPGVAKLIGISLTHCEVGRAILEMDASSRHANPMGTLHGGILCDLADLAMGFATASTLEDDESFTTLDLTTKFFKPIWNAHLRATAQVTKRTRTLVFIECEVQDDKESLVAKVFSSCMVLRGAQAQGR